MWSCCMLIPELETSFHCISGGAQSNSTIFPKEAQEKECVMLCHAYVSLILSRMVLNNGLPLLYNLLPFMVILCYWLKWYFRLHKALL